MRSTSVVRQSVQVSVGNGTNIVIGLAFQLLLADNLGLSTGADVYLLATMVPTLFATIFIGTLPSLLVPHLVRPAEAREDGRLHLGVFRRLTLVLTLVACGCATAALLLSWTSTFPVSPDLQRCFGIAVLAVPVAWSCGLLQAVLMVNQRFAVVGFLGAVNGVALVLLSAPVFAADLGPVALTCAFLGGYLCQLGVELVVCRGLVTLRSGATQPDEITRGIPGFCASALVFNGQPLIERTLAASVDGGPAAINYAGKMAQAALMVSSLGLGVVSLPHLSVALTRRDFLGAWRIAARMTDAIAALAGVLVSVGIVGASYLIQLVYEHGSFGRDASPIVAMLLQAALVGVLFSALTAPYLNIVYGMGRYRAVARWATASTLLSAGLGWALLSVVGLPGVAVGTSAMLVVNWAVYVCWASRICGAAVAPSVARQLWFPLVALALTAVAGHALSGMADRLPTVVLLLLVSVPGVVLLGMRLMALRRRSR